MPQTVFFTNKRVIGEILIQSGKLRPDQLERALTHQKTVPHRLGEILISLGFISEEDMITALAEVLSLDIFIPRVDDHFLPIEITPSFHREHPFALIRRKSGQTVLVVSDPLDSDILSTADMVAPAPFTIELAQESHIKKIMDAHYGLGIHDTDDVGYAGEEADIDKLKDMASEAPVIKYVNTLIDTAINRRASDIHLEPFEEGMIIRFRIDGILHDYEIPPQSMQAAVISRTKLLAGLDIAERRLPQDGKISMRISGREIDLRVSTMPTVYGEGVVVRILEKGSIILEMSQLGMNPEIERRFKEIITVPHGIIMVTGPTGSGKTTTLYCALNHINSGDNKIITIEDPVEYQLHGINQIQVRPEIGLTFARGLRSIVRQDPDVIMIGEIRDLDTAEIAVQSSLTGHLVFSTLHTNDSLSAVIRMIDIGVERFLISSSLRAVLSQRLVRNICQHCKTQKGMISELLGYRPDNTDFAAFKGTGCERCNATGYSGRIGLFEFLVITEAMSRGISQGLDLMELKDIADREGFQPIFTDGLTKIREGMTSLAEVMRVCRATNDGTL